MTVPSVCKNQVAETMLFYSAVVPTAAFGGISLVSTFPVEQNKTALLYTVPISIVANLATSVLAVMIGLVSLVSSSVFVIAALCQSKEGLGHTYWMSLAKRAALIGGLLVAGAPAIAVINTVAPFFVRDSLVKIIERSLSKKDLESLIENLKDFKDNLPANSVQIT